jgi:hypothetical protein
MPTKPLVSASLDNQTGNRNYQGSLINKTIDSMDGSSADSNQQHIEEADEVNIHQGISEMTWALTVLVFGGLLGGSLTLCGFLFAIIIKMNLQIKKLKG